MTGDVQTIEKVWQRMQALGPIYKAFLFVLLLFLNILPESEVLWLSSGGTPESEFELLKSNNYLSSLTVFYFS